MVTSDEILSMSGCEYPAAIDTSRRSTKWARSALTKEVFLLQGVRAITDRQGSEVEGMPTSKRKEKTDMRLSGAEQE